MYKINGFSVALFLKSDCHVWLERQHKGVINIWRNFHGNVKTVRTDGPVPSYGPITVAIRARFEYDSSTIRARFSYNTLQHATRFSCARIVLESDVVSRSNRTRIVLESCSYRNCYRPITGLGGTVKLLAPSAVLTYRKILLLLRIVNSHHAKRTYKSAFDA